ncbi:MAG: ribonuclease PH, partial [Vibrio metschnikovii]
PFSHDQLLALLVSAQKGIVDIVAAQKAALAE